MSVQPGTVVTGCDSQATGSSSNPVPPLDRDRARVRRCSNWDTAGAGVPLDDIAFSAWNTLPLEILEAAPGLAQRSARVIRAGQDAGDPGMLNLATVGEPERTERRLEDLRARVPEIARHL